jgi:cellulose synthase/poly-beta-1,6-N-acetylglucosamine synthase-like glycosyltransferase
MEYLKTIIKIIEWSIFLYLGSTTLYLLFFAIAGFLPTLKPLRNNNIKRKIAVLIPGYKEDAVIIEVAKDALRQNYPADLFEVIIIADSFKQETLDKLKTLQVKLIEVSFKTSTKAKALNKAMEIIGDNYDIALVLDADNTMESDFLKKINESFNQGFSVVQAHRIAKNMNTTMAILDAISEEINNFIFRKAHRKVGLSAALIGSGMAFEYKLFKNMMKNIDAIGGFDKQLEMELLKNKFVIQYINNAYVLDEKVQKESSFSNQRRRWLSAQFIYFSQNILSGFYHLIFKANFDYFDKVIQMGQLPRVLLLGISFIITMLYIAAHIILPEQTNILSINTWYWVILTNGIITALALSVPRKFYNKKTLIAIFSLPKAFFIMFLTLFKLKGANKKFIHTKHGI